MSHGEITFYALVVVFVATLIRSALGFGEALFAVPLLALCLPLKTAAPLAVLISIIIAAVIVVQDWRNIHLRSAGWLLGSTLFGIPLGLMLLTNIHQQVIKLLLALVIILFAIYSLSRIHLPVIPGDNKLLALGCGFVAGVLGGAYGMNGPPLAVYGTARGWSPQQFRATLQGYFLPASLLGLAGYWWQGLWSADVTHYFLITLPAALPAIWLGRLVNHRLPVEKFRKAVFFGLIIIGLVLAFQAVLF